MSETFYVVRYTGPFGFIKPWTAVRDGETYSQQFLTPSIIEGMRQKLEVSSIARHRLLHRGFDVQQERTQTAGYDLAIVKSRRTAVYKRPTSILNRGVMLQPTLHLAFHGETDAASASRQHLCLCRNEDVILPDGQVRQMSKEDFDALPGFELHFGRGPQAFMVGYNRFDEGKPMYGTLAITGIPVDDQPLEL